ncbi:MAG: patatin-like phospholipase family protein [Bacteroidia bacterium]|nr:patatin-like phospholipase family protein [Bacteroidia bacterium]
MNRSFFPQRHRNCLYCIFLLIVILASTSCSRKFMVVENPASQPPARILDHPPRVALVLGGGAFHGMAHVGVLKVLEHGNIPIDLIVGTSAGSMVGALYADYPHIDSLIPLVNATTTKDVFDFSLFRSSEGFVSGKRLQDYLTKNLHHSNIEDLPIPYVAVTTDMSHGKSIALAAGPIAASVNASCAIPYIFEPVKMYGTIFSDGGVLDAVATDVASTYHPQVIIAVDVMAYYDTVPVFKNKRQVLLRAYSVAAHKLKEERLPLADVLISPDLKGMPLMSSKDNDKMFQAGIKAAQDAMPRIREILIEKGIIR